MLLISFIGIGVFGFVSRFLDDGGYISKAVLGKFFPKKTGIDFAVFKFYAFKFFSKAVLSFYLIILIIATLALVLPVSRFKPPLKSNVNFNRFRFLDNYLLEYLYRFKQKLYFWFSLHINSPDFCATINRC
ncbi:hypothetical protein A2567_00490 [Candidatus Azambacteria bacterium RIFOXYD1_FULL_42_11]|uniref:Uncharacterized protein n=1 Tax=Candidatus Azambacteria bacterium RIFOXYD1_FULL_42_11 TaxID=1797310 RepID=A0A1F5CG50_9BACT|nr:MAG: hypothetical protein A2567_00490 [Candidatus Azambacteria bacterium RIFOXYD1_FULL_42_11]